MPFTKLTQFADDIPDEIFRAICAIVHDYCGLAFDPDSRFIVQKRVAKRLVALGLNDYQSYYYHLLYDKDGHQELDCLVELLTTPETYFFREQNQLNAFSKEILPELFAREKRTIKIWSAGCASGEEPYTIAMLILEESVPKDCNIEIYASDINRTLLQQARAGIYRESAFRAAPDYYRAKYFEREDTRHFRINDEVKKLVTFGWINLYDTKHPAVFGAVDIIFCRNVIIYFNKEGKRKVIESFYDKLNPEGYLLLGHSESLLNITTRFKLKHLKHDMVYQK